jgi:hypothetical protein
VVLAVVLDPDLDPEEHQVDAELLAALEHQGVVGLHRLQAGESQEQPQA